MRKIALALLITASQVTLANQVTEHFFNRPSNLHAMINSAVTTPLYVIRADTWHLDNQPTLLAKVTAVRFYYETDRITGSCLGSGQTYDLSNEPYFDTGIPLNGEPGALPPIPIYAAGFSYAANQLHYEIPTHGRACAKLFFSFKASPLSSNNQINTQYKARTFEYSNITSPGNNIIGSGIAQYNHYTLKPNAHLTLDKATTTENPVDTGNLSATENTITLSNIGFHDAILQLDSNLRARGITTNCSHTLNSNTACQFTYDGSRSRGDGAITATNVLGTSSKVIYPFHINKSGQAKCWGLNDKGQLGDGTTTNRDTATPIPSMTDVKQIASGKSHACALKNNGEVYCWGDNSLGQLGIGSTESSSQPKKVSSISGAVSITAGRYHTCTLLKTGDVKCWGEGNFGQLGNNRQDTAQTTPVAVQDLNGKARAITAGNNHTCALLTTGTVKCWGANDLGQIGNGTRTLQLTPAPVSNLKNDAVHAVGIAAGGNHSCAVLSDSSAKCWGQNDKGQLGIGRTGFAETTPQRLQGHYNDNIAAITAGNNHTCALTEQGGMTCWGLNTDGQLGIGDFHEYKTTPQPVTGFRYGVVGITAQANTTCAIKSAGKVFCWGNNEFGQIGDGTLTWRDEPTATIDMRNKSVAIAKNSGEGQFNCTIE